ncbi:hypothetical protein LTS10_002904 [Elasticomyces elasticus]|nr:hypothetical protein LTS10_002904 [Elasticomyces elasticus]
MSLAAHFTDLHVEFVEGVKEVDRRTLPPGGDPRAKIGVLGCWRAHLNVMRMIVDQNISTALVLEDDSDWDIRIKSQMQVFAKASRLLIQPVPGTPNRMLDPTYPQPGEADIAQDFDMAKEVLVLHPRAPRFPSAGDKIPLGRVVVSNDETVPERQHVDEQFGDKVLKEEYPDHTRVVTRAKGNVYTLAYAVFLPGARRILYELGMHKMDAAYDLMLRAMCEGKGGRKMRTCLTVQPMLFQHHRPIDAKSSFTDIGTPGAKDEVEYTETAFTRNIRWSTRVNFPKLIDGETSNYTDLFRDGEPTPELTSP